MSRIHIGTMTSNEGKNAIVITEHRLILPSTPGGRETREAVVLGIERPGTGFHDAADRLVEIAHQTAHDEPVFILDGDGGGHGLKVFLSDERRAGRFPSARWPVLYQKQGRDRQDLVDALVVAAHSKRLHFAGKLPHLSDMQRALLTYRRKVADDGLIGSELVIALGLTLLYPRYGPQPRVVGKDGQVYFSRESASLAGTGVSYG